MTCRVQFNEPVQPDHLVSFDAPYSWSSSAVGHHCPHRWTPVCIVLSSMHNAWCWIDTLMEASIVPHWLWALMKRTWTWWENWQERKEKAGIYGDRVHATCVRTCIYRFGSWEKVAKLEKRQGSEEKGGGDRAHTTCTSCWLVHMFIHVDRKSVL